MDFNDTPEEAAFRSEARSWLDANAKPKAPGERSFSMADQRGDPDLVKSAQEWQWRKADAHWACITWPSEYVGRGATTIQSVIWNPEEVPALVDRAIEVGGAHAIKFTQACLAEYENQPDPLFPAALADMVIRMEELKEKLGLAI